MRQQHALQSLRLQILEDMDRISKAASYAADSRLPTCTQLHLEAVPLWGSLLA